MNSLSLERFHTPHSSESVIELNGLEEIEMNGGRLAHLLFCYFFLKHAPLPFSVFPSLPPFLADVVITFHFLFFFFSFFLLCSRLRLNSKDNILLMLDAGAAPGTRKG
jgi:hypothetical protein